MTVYLGLSLALGLNFGAAVLAHARRFVAAISAHVVIAGTVTDKPGGNVLFATSAVELSVAASTGSRLVTAVRTVAVVVVHPTKGYFDTWIGDTVEVALAIGLVEVLILRSDSLDAGSGGN